MKKLALLIVIVFCIFAFGTMSVHAATPLETWCLSVGGTWSDDTCIISGISTYNAGDLEILRAETLDISSDASFRNAGPGHINNYGTIYNDGNFSNIGTINNDGDINNYGIISNENDINNYGNGTIKNYGLIDNRGIIDNKRILININIGDIYNFGGIYNFDNLENNGDIYNYFAIYNYGYFPNFDNLDNRGDIHNFGELANYGNLENNGDIYNRCLGTITGNSPVVGKPIIDVWCGTFLPVIQRP